MKRELTVLAVLWPLLASTVAAQPVLPRPAPLLDVYLDCQARGCDSEHFRNEIAWVNWVRERTAADVHLLITAEDAGGGGSVYALSFTGLGAYADDGTTLRLSAPQVLANAERRDLLTARIAQGLLQYAVHTSAADRIRVVFDGARSEAGVAAAPTHDPWNSWVFGMELEASLDGESREASHEFELSFDAARVTADTRLELELQGTYEEDRFQLRTGEHTFVTKNWELEALATRALSPRWSTGIAVETGRSTFENQEFFVRPAAVLEYSFYPYDEFSRRRLTLQYSLGGRHAEYAELTIYDRLREQRFDQRLSLAASFQQRWGQAWSSVGGSHYLHDGDRYRLWGEVGVQLRVFRGFSVDVSAEYSRVHDQLYIPAGDADDEEVLLRRRALETNYRYRTSFGLRYAFGSVYNNIVNPRISDLNEF